MTKTNLTVDQVAILDDLVELWTKASGEGAMDLRDYNRRRAEALRAALAPIVVTDDLVALGLAGMKRRDAERYDGDAADADEDMVDRELARACLEELVAALNSRAETGSGVTPCYECGSTEMIGTACKRCNPEITDPNFGTVDDASTPPVTVPVSEAERIKIIAAVIDRNKVEPWTVDRAEQMAREILTAVGATAALTIETLDVLEKEAREELEAHEQWLNENDEEPDQGADHVGVHPNTLLKLVAIARSTASATLATP